MSLTNVHKYINHEKDLLFHERYRRLNSNKSESELQTMYIQSKRRVESSTKEILQEPNIIKALNEGIIPLINPIHHDFRPKNQNLNKDDFPWLRNYLPAKERAIKCEENTKCAILEKGPFRSKIDLGRIDDKQKNIIPLIRHGFKTENERILTEIGKQSMLDYTSKDNKMIIKPNWKEENKQKWIDTKTFIASNSLSQGKKSAQAWSFIPSEQGPYIDGLEAIGDKCIVRNRSKEKEQNHQLFFHSCVNTGFRGLENHQSESILSQKYKDLQLDSNKNNSKLYVKSSKQFKLMGNFGDITNYPTQDTISKSMNIKSKSLKKVYDNPIAESPIPKTISTPKKQECDEMGELSLIQPSSTISKIASLKNLDDIQTLKMLRSKSLLTKSSIIMHTKTNSDVILTNDNIKSTIDDYFQNQHCLLRALFQRLIVIAFNISNNGLLTDLTRFGFVFVFLNFHSNLYHRQLIQDAILQIMKEILELLQGNKRLTYSIKYWNYLNIRLLIIYFYIFDN